MRNIFKEGNEIKFINEENEKGAKLPSKMSRKALYIALKKEGVNSGLLKSINIKDNRVIFYIKKGEKLSPGEFPLAENKYQWKAIENFLIEMKVNRKIINIIREEGIALSLKSKLIKIGK